jgi:hypothetical protein
MKNQYRARDQDGALGAWPPPDRVVLDREGAGVVGRGRSVDRLSLMTASRPQLAERIWRAIEEARNSAAYRKLEQAEGVRH